MPRILAKQEIIASASGKDWTLPTVIDAETGHKVAWLKWVDTKTGEYAAYREDPSSALRRYESAGIGWEMRQAFVDSLIFHGKARLPIPIQRQRGTKREVTPNSPAEEAKEIRRIARDYGLVETPAIEGLECEYPGCHSLARYRTGDEQIIDPAVGENGELFERAFTRKVHRYCQNPRHFRLPVQKSIRGVESEVEVETRPQ